MLAASNADCKLMDFDDILYMPLLLSLPLPTIPLAFIDEAQDASVIQCEILRRCVTRLIAVGDPYQSIYAFQGGGVDAMHLLRSQFSVRQMPLSVSYRCPRAIAQLAREINPAIESAPETPEGQVDSLDLMPSLFASSDFILCRTNAPLIALAVSRLRTGSHFRLRNDRFIRGLIRDFSRLRSGFIAKLESRLASPDLSPNARDRLDSMLHLARASGESLPDIRATIDHLARSATGPMLSTIHGVKGLGAPHVYILRPDLLPPFWAKQPWERQQELNLRYVAITRAQQHLTFIQENQS